MISKYIVTNIENLTLEDYLLSYHLSKVNINRLDKTFAITDENGQVINKSHILKDKQTIYINYSLIEDNSSQVGYKDASLKILYESDDLIACEKECNCLVHSDGVSNNTLLNRIVYYLQDKYDDSFVRPLHRLDWEASGVVLFSKNIFSHASITYLFENRLIEKKYLLVVRGILKGEGQININIGKDRHNSKKYVVVKSGKEAITNYKVIKNYKDSTLVEAKILTGRPHQIRLSFASINHKVVGDKIYGNGKGDLKLLSKEISFVFNKEIITIKAKKELI